MVESKQGAARLSPRPPPPPARGRQQQERLRQIEAIEEEEKRRRQAEQQEQLEVLQRQQEEALRKKHGRGFHRGGARPDSAGSGASREAPGYTPAPAHGYGSGRPDHDPSRVHASRDGLGADGETLEALRDDALHQASRFSSAAPAAAAASASAVPVTVDIDDLPAGAKARAEVLRNTPGDVSRMSPLTKDRALGERGRVSGRSRAIVHGTPRSERMGGSSVDGGPRGVPQADDTEEGTPVRYLGRALESSGPVPTRAGPLSCSGDTRGDEAFLPGFSVFVPLSSPTLFPADSGGPLDLAGGADATPADGARDVPLVSRPEERLRGSSPRAPGDDATEARRDGRAPWDGDSTKHPGSRPSWLPPRDDPGDSRARRREGLEASGKVPEEGPLGASSFMVSLPGRPSPSTKAAGGRPRARDLTRGGAEDGPEAFEQPLASDSILFYLTEAQKEQEERANQRVSRAHYRKSGGASTPGLPSARGRGVEADGEPSGSRLSLRLASVSTEPEAGPGTDEEESMSPLTRLLAATDVRLRRFDLGSSSDIDSGGWVHLKA